MVFVATCGASLLHPESVRASSGTLTVETPLHQEPRPDAPLIALLSQGVEVIIDGPPVDGFYPVTAEGVSGWMRGETVSLQKEIVAEEVWSDATPVTPIEQYPAEPMAADPALTYQDATSAPAPAADPSVPLDTATDAGADGQIAGEPAWNDAPAGEPVADPAAQQGDPATTMPPSAPVQTGETVADPPATGPSLADPASTDMTTGDAPAADPTNGDPSAAQSAPPAEGTLVTPQPDAAPAEAAWTPVPEPTAAPVPSEVSGPEGPASVAADLPIRVGPGPDYSLISTAPRGSTVNQTGHIIDGYVSVQFNDITGWAAADQLVAPGTVSAETPAGTTASGADPTPTDPDAKSENGDSEKRNSRKDTTEPEPPPSPTPEPAPVGPASTLVDMPITYAPGPNSGLIFTVPAGSAVEQTGQLVDGYVSVRYKEVVGWAAREHLGEPIAFVDESLDEEDADPVKTKTPKPGSGVAYTTVDLSLRAGPSAEEEPIVVVPAGEKVVLTGVMEGNFQRVTYGEEIGWVSNDYLTNPEDPTPPKTRKGKEKSYSERQIIRIINKAADRYGQSRSDMVRVARCESNLDPYAVNPSGSYGLFQFIRSTWKSTPYGNEDIFDPEANANAAAWMWKEGRKSEWVCQ